jgi:hypothetical protein
VKAATTVMGIDLSQTGLGLVAIPHGWDLDWTKIARITVGRPLKKGAPPWFAIERLVFLADECVAFARKHGVTHVWIEGLPTHGGQFFASGQLEQVGGAVRYALWSELRLVSNTVPLNTGRKTVMGKLPRSDVKRIVHETIRSFSQLSDWTGDELDAWVAANHGVCLLGGCAVVGEAA